MPLSFKNRSFLKLLDFTSYEIRYLIDLSIKLKSDRKFGDEDILLKGKNIALVFEKNSTRTRCAAEIAAHEQGANVTYLSPEGTQIGHKESMKDTARVLGRLYDGILYRGSHQQRIEELAEYSGIPVWNGLTNEFHPTQVLADLLTMIEHCNKPLNEIRFAYLGDCRFNMANSYLVAASIMGMDARFASPKQYFHNPDLWRTCKDIAMFSGANLMHSNHIDDVLPEVDFVITDVWVSMGESQSLWAERIETFKPYQVNKRVMTKTGNQNVKFMHCLPAFHNTETDIGMEIYKKFDIKELEVTDDVFESSASIVFDEAENRLHTMKAVMVATLR